MDTFFDGPGRWFWNQLAERAPARSVVLVLEPAGRASSSAQCRDVVLAPFHHLRATVAERSDSSVGT
jgi:hypothetical protein